MSSRFGNSIEKETSWIKDVRSAIYAVRDPLKKTVFGYDHPLTDVERGKAVRTEQDVSVGAGDAQRSSDMIGCQGDGKLLMQIL